MAALLLAMIVSGRLSPERAPDTASYERFPLREPTIALRQIRTAGYPLLLAAASPLGADHSAVPLLQALLHCLAVAALMGSLRAWSLSRGASCLAASGVLWSNTQWRYAGTLVADSAGLSAAVLTVAALLWLLRRRTTLAWVATGALLFATYQFRPAYLFLVPLLPLLALGVQWLLAPERPRRSRWRIAGGVALLAALPLLAFCGIRWAVVGHFHLVAFGGYNASGVTGQFLDERLASQLPEHLQPLAREALRRRAELIAAGELTGEVTTSYSAIEQRFDASTWRVFVPAARQMSKGDLLRTNQLLTDLAAAIVVARPRLYLTWLAKASVRGVYLTFAELLVNPFVLAILFAWLLLHFRLIALRRQVPPASDPSRAVGARGASTDADAFSLLLLVAVAFAAGKLALIVITTPPLGRFTEAAGVLVPAAVAAAVAEQWGEARRLAKIASGRTSRRP